MPLPLTIIQSIARGLVYTPPELRQRAFNDMAPAFGVAAAELDNEFARVEQNYPAARCKELIASRKPPTRIRRTAFCCGAEANGLFSHSKWGY